MNVIGASFFSDVTKKKKKQEQLKTVCHFMRKSKKLVNYFRISHQSWRKSSFSNVSCLFGIAKKFLFHTRQFLTQIQGQTINTQ